jgi:hypothetical protein
MPYSVLHIPLVSIPPVNNADNVTESTAAAACRDVACHASCDAATRCMQCSGQFAFAKSLCCCLI